MNLAKTCTRPLGGKLISVEAFIIRKITSSSVDSVSGLKTPVGSLVAWELLYLWNSVPMVTEETLNAMVQVRVVNNPNTVLYFFAHANAPDQPDSNRTGGKRVA